MSSRNPLLIRDTFLEILDFLNPVHDCTTLLALATTCKEVSEHSLDYMWRILPSLRQLILLLPPDRLERMDPPTPAEWGIINRYSGRVRELAVVDVNDPHSLRFLECISSAISPLFPKLTHLTWYPPHDTSIALVYPLLSPTLTELYMNFPATDNAILQSFLQDYPSRCPALQTITFLFAEEQLEQEFETTLYFASQAVCNLKRVNLQYFTQINIPVDTAALRHLALSPNLRVLDIEHHPSNQGQIDLSPEDMPFRSLEELRLETPDLGFFSTLLRPEYQKFHKLEIRFNQRPTVATLKTFFTKLTSRSENPLEELILKYVYDTRQQSQVGIYGLDYSLLSPLALLRHLYRLEIRWDSAISLDDKELGDFVRNWPSLESLKLYSGHEETNPPVVPVKYPTLKALLILVKSCPKIRSISLTVDARERIWMLVAPL